MSDLIDVVRALRVELEQAYRRDARSREDVVEALHRAATAEVELERALKVVRAAEAWRQYSNGTADADVPVVTMIQHFEVAIEALNVAVDLYREGRDGDI